MKNKIIAEIITYSTYLFILMLLFYFIQQHFFVSHNLLFTSYLINYSLALLIFIVLLKLAEKHIHLLGFVYLGGSLLKFAVYFLLIHSKFKADGTISKTEASVFLIPYFLCLIYETTYLVKLINRKNY